MKEPPKTSSKPSQLDERQLAGVLGEYFRHWLKYTLLWTPVLTFFAVLIHTDTYTLNSITKDFFISCFIGEIVMTVCLTGSYLLYATEYWFCAFKKIPLKTRSRSTHLIRSMLFVVPAMYFAFHLTDWVCEMLEIGFKIPSFAGYKRGLVIGAGSILVFEVYDLIKLNRAQQRDMDQLEKENLKSQIKSLTAQMNPHFLFNSLNSIASTIKTDSDNAETMTVDLAQLYRKILMASKLDKHSVDAELEICKSYLKLEQARFGDRLTFEVEIDPTTRDHLIPSLIVQPLVENAVKHGISPKTEGGTITISTSQKDGTLKINVCDNGVGMSAQASPPRSTNAGTGTSIKNIRERLRLTEASQNSLSNIASQSGCAWQISIGTQELVHVRT